MFSPNKIVSILLYVVFGVSVLIVAFFYFGDSLIDEAAYNAKLSKLEAGDEYSPVISDWEMDADTAIVDTEADTAVAPAPPVAPRRPAVTREEVKFTFFERLIYFKTDIALGWAYILVGITALLALIFPLFYMFSNTKSMIQLAGVLVIAAVIVGVAYLLSSDTPMNIPGFEGTDSRDPAVLKFVDTAVFTTYFLIGLSLLSILFSEVSKYFK